MLIIGISNSKYSKIICLGLLKMKVVGVGNNEVYYNKQTTTKKNVVFTTNFNWYIIATFRPFTRN